MTKTKFLKNVKDFSALFILIAAALSLVFFKGAKSSFTEGLKLWYACVLPTLFPYLFITAALSENQAAGKLFSRLSPVSEKVFNINGAAFYAFFISLMSGYPIGAKTVADLYKNRSVNGAETVRAAALCSTASPVFLIVATGGVMFGSIKFGLILFLTHFISAITVGIAFSFYKRKQKPLKSPALKTKKSANFLFECAQNSVLTVLVVGGIMAVFFVLTDFLAGVFSPAVNLFCGTLKSESLGKGLFFSFFEITKGLKYVAEGGINFFTLPICAFICGFGGLSVIAQSMAFLKSAKIKTSTFVLIKLSVAVINFVVGILLSPLFFI